MSRLTLFVGGPCDGRQEYVEEGLSHVEVVEYPPHTLFGPANELAEVTVRRHQYHLAPFDVAAVHDRRWIAYPTGWTLSQAVGHMFSGYAKKAAVIARHKREYGI